MRLYKLLFSVSFFFATTFLSGGSPHYKQKTRASNASNRLLSQREPLVIEWPQVQEFAKNYGYFSSAKPLVGKVTSSSSDLAIVANLLRTLPQDSCDLATFDFVQGEILTKVLAYRDLAQGQSLSIPIYTSNGIQLETFTVDRVFNIWRGMPAFGLVPASKNTSSLLLFRGTDLSPITKRGLASILSDLDPAGPGLHAFLNVRKELKEWLKTVHAEGQPARVLGFSLGGALASYTFIYAHPFLSDEPSIAICPPGVSNKVRASFYRLAKERQSHLITYINAGDVVSQIGCLLGTVYSLSTQDRLKPLTAHTALFSAYPDLYRTRVHPQ